MTGLEIWLLAVGLAMDCFAVSIASGIILKRARLRPMLVMAISFGFFQALMPLLGWIGASFFSHLIESIDHWIAFGILAFLGGRMIMESFKDEDCKHEYDPTANASMLVATARASTTFRLVGSYSCLQSSVSSNSRLFFPPSALSVLYHSPCRWSV